MAASVHQRAHGQFYTRGNPFRHPAFHRWAQRADLSNVKVLEPFAGANSLIRHLESLTPPPCENYISFDIEPGAADVKRRDTLASFPRGYEACVTNPPWLARNSATRRGLNFPDCDYDDLYKFALGKCLDGCKHVAALVPESFIRANVFQDRLTDFISLTSRMFEDTGHPTGLALFSPDQSKDVCVWSGPKRIGLLSNLERHRPIAISDGPRVVFNEPDGNLGLIAIDDTRGDSIRFCKASELRGSYDVKQSSRAITIMHVDAKFSIRRLNSRLHDFRKRTQDVLLTCFKGVRKDGKYRRRLDWDVARGLVHAESA